MNLSESLIDQDRQEVNARSKVLGRGTGGSNNRFVSSAEASASTSNHIDMREKQILIMYIIDPNLPTQNPQHLNLNLPQVTGV